MYNTSLYKGLCKNVSLVLNKVDLTVYTVPKKPKKDMLIIIIIILPFNKMSIWSTISLIFYCELSLTTIKTFSTC